MKVAYVTGGYKGIGLGITHHLLEIGYAVGFSGRNGDALRTVELDLNKKYTDKVIAIESDVRRMDDELSAKNAIVEKFGRLDVVIANAGVGHFAPIDELTDDQWNDVIDINLTGVFHTLKATLDQLKEHQGYFITIASLAGTNFFAQGAAYNASKFGLVGFTQAVMLDLRKYGVKVSTIMPGSVSTYFNNNTPSEADSWKIQPEDIGQLVVDLLQMNPRTLPSKIEVRPTIPPSARK